MKFDSPVFNITKKESLPPRSVYNRFKKLSFYPELLDVLKKIKNNPFEDAITIDLAKITSKDRASLNQKNPSLSFYIHLRNLIKRLGAQTVVEIRRTGERIYILYKKIAHRLSGKKEK